MLYYKRINFPDHLVTDIRNSALDEMKNINLDSSTFFFLEEPFQLFNQYLQSVMQHSIMADQSIVFRRPAKQQQPIHVDSRAVNNPYRVLCAINIPLLNCDDSEMRWYSGDYNLDFKTVQTAAGPRRFFEIQWSDTTTIQCVESVVIDSPTLVRVNVPHQVTASSNIRCMLTIRFSTNPSFDDVAKHFEC